MGAFGRAILVAAREWRTAEDTAAPWPSTRWSEVDLAAVQALAGNGLDLGDVDPPSAGQVGRRSRSWVRWPWQWFGGMPALLGEWGFGLEPGGEWLRHDFPGVFLPVEGTADADAWPWAATGLVSGRTMLIAQQRVRIRTRMHLTIGRTRTACIVHVPGADLPVVVITGSQAVPPTVRPWAIDLGAVSAGRALWAWGPDPKGFDTVVRQLTMSAILSGLPGGACVSFGGEKIVLYCDDPVPTTRIADYVWLAHRLADLVPKYLIQPTGPA